MKKKKTGRRVLSFLLTLAMVVGLMPGMVMTAYAAGEDITSNTTIVVSDACENDDYTVSSYDKGEYTVKEGVVVTFECSKWWPEAVTIYLNGTAVATWSGRDYKSKYVWTAKKDAKINWEGYSTSSANIYLTETSTVAVNSVTLAPTTATLTVGDVRRVEATVLPANATDKTVKWSVGGTDTGAVKLYSDSACTTEVGADATDKLTVYAKGESAGSATVTATSNADSTKSASCDVTVNAAQTQTEELLTTITPTGKTTHSATVDGVVTVSHNNDSYYGTYGWLWMENADTLTVSACEGYTITKCIFKQNEKSPVTDSSTPFELHFDSWGGGSICRENSAMDGVTSIEVYGYATPTATHSVTITAGDHMTKNAGSGDAEQTGLTGAMKDVVYTADKGYYFPTNYSVAEVSGIKVTRDSYTQITVSGTPTADATITLTAPTAKTTPAAPTTAAAVDCTTTDNNDGKLTGVTTAMEYKKSDDDSWTTGTGSDITGLVPGTYYVRVKATETTNASTNQELTVKGFISYTVTFKVVNGKWNKGEGDAATADKTVTLTGHDGDTLKLTADQIPAVGTKPNDTYKVGSWDVTPSADKKITADTTYTYTYAAKEASVVTKAPEAKTLTYNGSAQELVTAGKATGGEMKYALGTATKATQPYTTSIPTATNAGTYYVWYKVKADENHNDTDANYVKVSIGKRSVILTSATVSKTYDGTALTNTNVTVGGDGFVTGEGATYDVTGTQTLPGNSKNTFGYTLKTGTTAGNYEITKTEGTLTVTDRTDVEGNDKKYEITVTANSDEVTYDGTEKSVSGFVQTTFTFNGVTYTVSGLTATVKGTDAGSYTVSVSGTAVVKDSKNNDLTKQFIVNTSNGTLTINKRNVTLTSATDTKEYDGDALTNTNVTVGGDGFVTDEGADYDVTGTRTVVGVSENTFTYTLKDNTKADNYDITPSFGTLTVTNRNTKYEVTLKANSGTEKYDGKEKTVSGYTIDGNAGEGTGESAVTSFTASNGKTYTVTGMSAEVTGTNAGEYVVNVIGTPIVKDADGNDVSDQFSVIPQTGTLTINKRSVTLTSAKDTKVYDGKALSNDEITVSEDGFAEGEGATYSVTGSQKVVGSSANAFTYSLNEGTIADNYDITTVEGKLTVTKSDSSGEVTAVSGLVYDGKAKALVTAGKTKGGTLMYRLGTNGKWQSEIPEATDAGTYKIYYYIKGDDNHKDDGSEKEPKGSVETTIKKATINLKSVTQKNNKVQVRWTKVNEADGYDVYVHYCGSKAKKPVKTIKKNTTTKTSVAKINGKKINQKKNFRVKVYAYKMVKGKKKIIAKTITAHLAGTKSVKYTNPKALKLTKSTYSIKIGKTAKIKAKVTRKNSKKKLLPKSHAAKLRYKSSNTKIATVNKNGTIKGKKKGTCYIYVYTVNGLMKKVKVTVK